MGQGTKTIFPQLVAEALGRRRTTTVEIAPQDTAFVPDCGPDRRVADGDGRRRAARSRRPRRLRAQVEARDRRPVRRRRTATYAREHGALRDRPAVRAVPGRRLRRRDLPRRRLPGVRLGGLRGEVDVDLDTGEVHVRDVVAADDVGRVIHPVLAEGQVEGGTLQAVGYATIEEIKLRDGRYLNDRLATYIIPTALDAPRITTILVEAPFAGAPHGAKGVGELPMDVGAPAVVAAIHDATGVWITRPAGQPGADPRARSPACPARRRRSAPGRHREPAAQPR